MKKCFAIFALFFICTAFPMDICTVFPMELVQKLYDWRDDKKSDSFLQDFGSKTCTQMTCQIKGFSSNVRNKIFNKAEAKHSESLKQNKLFMGAVILASLPYDMQKKVLQEIDMIFVDDAMVKNFLDRPLSQALRWAICFNRKMGDKQTYVFRERMRFGKKSSCELTRSQMFELSVDEIIILNDLSDSVTNKLLISYYKEFNKTQLVALDKLIRKGYISGLEGVDRTVDIVIENWFHDPVKLLKKVMARIIFPQFSFYYARQMLVPFDRLDTQKRLANSALQELETCGKGPYLKFEFDYIYSSGTIFKYFLIKLCDLVVIMPFDLLFHKEKLSVEQLFSFLYALCTSGLGCYASFFLLAGSLTRDVKIDEFKWLPLIQLLGSIGTIFIEEFLISASLKDNKKGEDVKTIPFTEIHEYLHNRWINIK